MKKPIIVHVMLNRSLLFVKKIWKKYFKAAEHGSERANINRKIMDDLRKMNEENPNWIEDRNKAAKQSMEYLQSLFQPHPQSSL